MHRIQPLDEEGVDDSLPRRHSRQLGAVYVDGVPVQLAAASVDIDLVRAQPAGALPQEAADPEGNDDGEGKVRLEEALDIVESTTDGADGDEKLETG